MLGPTGHCHGGQAEVITCCADGVLIPRVRVVHPLAPLGEGGTEGPLGCCQGHHGLSH